MQRREPRQFGSDGSYFGDLETVHYGNGLFLSWTGVPHRVKYEDDPTPPPPPPAPPAGDPPPPDPKPPAPGNKTFTQADIDRVVANQRRELQQKHLDEVNHMKRAQGLTAEEKNRLEDRGRELEDALMSEKELAKKEVDRIKKQLSEERDKEKSRAEQNWSLYTGSMIATEIATAAAKHKAFNAKQVEAIVKPICVVEDEKDEKLEKTGKHIVRVHTTKVSESGKPEKVTLSVDQFVAQMGESEDYCNLFLSDRPGGMGVRPGKRGSGPDSKTMTPKQKIAEGLRKR